MIQYARMTQKLRMHELFASVNFIALETALEGEYRVETFQRGDLIAAEETLTSAAVFLLSGSAIRRKIENNLCYERLMKGRLFGLESLFLGENDAANEIIATRESQVLFLTKTVFLRLLQLDSGFSLSVIRYLSSRVSALERRVTTYTGGSAKCRLGRFLQDAFGDYKTFELDRSMQQLATMLDISRPSLYRAFSELQDCGAIVRDGKSIRLISKDRLIKSISSDS